MRCGFALSWRKWWHHKGEAPSTTPRTFQKTLSISYLGRRLRLGTAGGFPSAGVHALFAIYDTYSTLFSSHVMGESNQSKRQMRDKLKRHALARVGCWSGIRSTFVTFWIETPGFLSPRHPFPAATMEDSHRQRWAIFL